MTLAAVLAGELHGVFRWTAPPGPGGPAEQAAEEAGWRYLLLDSEAATDKPAFMAACAQAFDLPSWFGANWDGLDECLRALDLEEPAGLLVVWQGWAGLADGDPDAFDTALEVLRDACVAWHDDEVPCAVLLTGDGPDTDLSDLG
jgi:RNAse (barnase) inhibitor barstar